MYGYTNFIRKESELEELNFYDELTLELMNQITEVVLLYKHNSK